MSKIRKNSCLIICAGFDILCLAANNFALDTRGFLLLVLTNYLLYWVISNVAVSKRRKKGKG